MKKDCSTNAASSKKSNMYKKESLKRSTSRKYANTSIWHESEASDSEDEHSEDATNVCFIASDQVPIEPVVDTYDDFTFEQLGEAFNELLTDYRKLRSKYQTSKKVLKEYKGEIGRLTDLLADNVSESGELSSVKLLLHETTKSSEEKDKVIDQLNEELSKYKKSLQNAQIRNELSFLIILS